MISFGLYYDYKLTNYKYLVSFNKKNNDISPEEEIKVNSGIWINPINYSGMKRKVLRTYSPTHASIHLSMQMTVVAWWVGEGKVILVMAEYEVDKARSRQWVPRVWWVGKQVGTIIGPNHVPASF